MSIVVFGGDCLGGIEKNLYAWGVKNLVHISGRKPFDRNKSTLPKTTDFVLVLTDFINHNTAKTAKILAKEQAVPIIYAKRSWCSIKNQLKTERIIEVKKN